MKKLVLLALAIVFFASCDTGGEDNPQFALGPVHEVTMASSFKVDSISEIMIRYKRPDDSHIFQGFYYQAVDFNRVVAIEYAKVNTANPGQDDQIYEVPLKFKPRFPGTYVFKFWDGTNQDGTDHFYVAEAVVNN
ncbi:DUF4625 domain-containing protein [Flavobacterium longum]|uniref:hypothetical protein n=1 Tax=Flavobacterium longum TaxID=1299340 RepID=UPI0039EA25B5